VAARSHDRQQPLRASRAPRFRRRFGDAAGEADAQDAAEDALDQEEQAALCGDGGVGGASERRARFERAAESLAEGQASPPRGRLSETSNKAKGRRLAAARKRGPNLTDPDSRVMKSGGAFVQAYNAQIAVSDDHLVLACEVTSDVHDHAQLEPMIDAVREQIKGSDQTTEFLADAGYWKGAAIARLQASGEEILVPPNGRPRTRKVGGSSTVTEMTDQLTNTDTAKRYRRRQALVEPVIAHIKCNRRLDRFLLRGSAGAHLEWALGCTAHNLKRLAQAT